MKYLILVYGSQQGYDAMAATSHDESAVPAAVGSFLEAFNQDLKRSGEFVDAQGLAAPVHARRIEPRQGVPVVTDGPYAETQEVLAGYWVVDCDSFDRATEIATRLSMGPGPESAVEVRPFLGPSTEPQH